MEFRILGPLEASEEGRPLDLGGAKQRALLAVLLLNANRVVSSDELIEALWQEEPPGTAGKALQVYVSQLRKAIGRDRILTRAPGYSIRVEPDELDLERFERLVAEGSRDALVEGLALWEGQPLADFAYERFAQLEIGRLEELRLAALEERIEADLALGSHADLVGELEALVSENPLRERLRGQLMLALYRSGRQAEALEAYQQARRTLVDELGIDPGRSLRELEQAILRQDSALDLEQPVTPRVEAAAVTAREEPESALAAIPLREERKVVSVLFVDLVGFTGRSEELDPEDVRAILDVYFGRARTELERFGGTVEKFIGDAVMALFGVPVAHGDDPERAVRAALAVRDSLIQLNETDPELDLQFRIGVNTGEAIVSLGVRPSEGEGMVAGDIVNTASRLEAAAPVNGILVGEEAYRATQTAIRYEEIEPVAVTGKQQPLRAWIAIESLAAPGERPPSKVPMIGRDNELSFLRGVWDRLVAERRPHLVTVIAPPGVGKTRLATELVRLLEVTGARIADGRSLPYGETASAGPFARQVKRVAGIFESDPIPAACKKLEQTVAALVGTEQAEEIAAPLAVLIGLSPAEEVVDKQLSFYAARRFVEALATDRPTVLVYEDIHWGEQVHLDLLEHLASRLRDVPVLLLALARPELLELRPSWGAGLPAYTRLSLEPLGAEESRELAARLLAQRRDAPAELATRLAETAEGNPLFIEELAASVLEGSAGLGGRLPTNVRGIIAARLDALPAEERAVLFNASVLGKVFWRGALGRIGVGGDRLRYLLDSLEQRDLIRRQPVSQIEGDDEFLFRHVLIRDVAYATLPRSIRRERHATAAAFIEEVAGERAGEWALVLAHHWREAGEPERELQHVVLAAERAWPSDGISLYDRALELISEGDPARRRALLLQRALVLVHASRFAEAIDELEALLPELEERERFEAVRARARAAFWVGDVDGAHAFGEQARSLAEELGDVQLEAVTLSFFSTLESMEGKVEEAIELSERAVALWKPGRDPREHADALTWLSLQNYWAGRYEPALEHALRAQHLTRETHSESSSDLGLALTGLGQHEEALAEFAQDAARGREIDLSPRWMARLMNMWAGTLRELGELEEARRLNEEAVELASSNDFPAAIASGKIDLLFADLAAGDVGRADTAWPELWQTAEQTVGWHAWLWRVRLSAARAETLLAQGRLDDAVAAAVEAVELAESYKRPKYALASRLVLGSALTQLKRHDQAVEGLRLALAEAEGLKHPPSVIRAAERLASGLLAAGEDDGAEAAFRRAKETIESFTAGLSEERRARFLETPPVAEVLALAR